MSSDLAEVGSLVRVLVISPGVCSLPGSSGLVAVWDKNYISQPPIQLVLSSGNEKNWSCGLPPAAAGLPEPCILPYSLTPFSCSAVDCKIMSKAWSVGLSDVSRER